jgi:hypothetical protein
MRRTPITVDVVMEACREANVHGPPANAWERYFNVAAVTTYWDLYQIGEPVHVEMDKDDDYGQGPVGWEPEATDDSAVAKLVRSYTMREMSKFDDTIVGCSIGAIGCQVCTVLGPDRVVAYTNGSDKARNGSRSYTVTVYEYRRSNTLNPIFYADGEAHLSKERRKGQKKRFRPAPPSEEPAACTSPYEAITTMSRRVVAL